MFPKSLCLHRLAALSCWAHPNRGKFRGRVWGHENFQHLVKGELVLAVSIAIPRKQSTLHVAIADSVPVAELIPHLVEDVEPGQQWVFSRAVGIIPPDQSLSDAGVGPGEKLTLDVISPQVQPVDAVQELSGPVAKSPALWVFAAIIAVFMWNREPIWSPIAWHSPSSWEVSQWVTVGVGMAASVLASAASLHDRRFGWLAAIVAFGVGLQCNVAAACLLAALALWNGGVARVGAWALVIFALANFQAPLTLLVAIVTLMFAGQIAIALARIPLPKVPATGMFTDPVESRAGNVVAIHSSLVVGLCIVVCACVVQIAPFGQQHSLWTTALCGCVALVGLTARSTRPIHATALCAMAGFVVLWIAFAAPWGPACLVLLMLPALRIKSPLVGRVLDVLEMLAICAITPLCLQLVGVFAAIRGIG